MPLIQNGKPAWLKSAWQRVNEPWRASGEGLQYWRERILFSVYFVAITLALIAYVPGILRMIESGWWWAVLVETFLYAIAICIFLFPQSLSYRGRALYAIGGTHLVGILVLSVLGPYSGGFIWLFTSAVMAGLLLGVHASIIALGGNTLTFIILGLLLVAGFLPWSDGGMQYAGAWFTTSANFMFLNILTALSAATMTRGLEQILSRQQKVSAQLEEERQELIQARSQLQSLAVELIEAEEKERQRIALILHDDLQQILASAKMQVQVACDALPSNSLLDSVEHLLEESINKSRYLSHELSPPILQYSGITAAVQWLIQKMNDQFGLNVDFTSNQSVESSEDPLFKTFVFRAVQEILFNVVKHSGVKDAEVHLYGEEKTLVIGISDKGRGFDPGILKGAKKSNGLGLVSLRERVSYMGGEFAVDSAPGSGSRFTLTLPFQMIDVQRSESKQVLPESGESLPASGINVVRVLFADDHTVMRQGLIRLIASQPGIEIVGEAASGLEAIEAAEKLHPDVIVMDVAMPETDGVEATRIIKDRSPAIRVIGLSMHEDEHICRQMRQAGAEAFVSKTASSGALLQAIYGKSLKPKNNPDPVISRRGDQMFKPLHDRSI